MAEIPNSLQSLFTARLEEQDGRYLLEVPESEIDHGAIDPSQTHRVALLEQPKEAQTQENTETAEEQSENRDKAEQKQAPPVNEGEELTVTIDSIGEQGDGVALVERGYVVIVPDTKPEDAVKIKIQNVKQNVAFAEVLERKEPKTAQR